MRFTSMALFGLAGLGMLAVPPVSGATVTKPSLPLVAPHGAHGFPGPQPGKSGRGIFAGGCNSNDPNGYFFVGIGTANARDFAGYFSGVLGGNTDEACDNYDGIGGGYQNTIGASGDSGAASNSFIGSGANNAITAYYAFVGTGQHNGVAGLGGFVGAGSGNTVTGETSFIGAGASNSASGAGSIIGAGSSNYLTGNGSFIGSGASNYVSGYDSFVGAGSLNNATGAESFVGVGSYNVASGVDSFVGGGIRSYASGNGSFIGGGDYASCNGNVCSTYGNNVSGVDSFIGDGDQNAVNASEAFVGGGSFNTIASNAEWGTIAGGHENAVAGALATIPGGANNIAAGVLSLAAGYHADASRSGSFVWSDYIAGSSVVKDSAPNQFVVRASGGTYLYSSENLQAGVKLAAGSGTWASLSDRNAKIDIAPLDDAEVLAKVATLPVSTWRYKTEAGVRHVGPMAQDFYAAFRVGEDDRHITSIDEDGVALSAIKALDADDVKLHAENLNLHAENARLRDRFEALEKKVEALAAR